MWLERDLDTVGKIIHAMLQERRLDLATGKAARFWDKTFFRQRLNATSTLFSNWLSGRQIPPTIVVMSLIRMAEEMGSRGERFLKPLHHFYQRIAEREK